MSIDTTAIRARLDAATPGPWWRGDEWPDGRGGMHANEIVISGERPALDLDSNAQGCADADFIAHAPQDVSDLLAEVERLRAANEVPEGLTKLSVYLTANSLRAMNDAAERYGDSRTDTVNRALQWYALTAGTFAHREEVVPG